MIQQYPPGQFSPQRGAGHNWHVWCEKGAEEVLEKDEHIAFLKENPTASFTVNLANGSFVTIQKHDRLWAILEKIKRDYRVEYYPLNFSGEFVDWDANKEKRYSFDAISISLYQ